MRVIGCCQTRESKRQANANNIISGKFVLCTQPFYPPSWHGSQAHVRMMEEPNRTTQYFHESQSKFRTGAIYENEHCYQNVVTYPFQLSRHVAGLKSDRSQSSSVKVLDESAEHSFAYLHVN